MNQEKIGKFIAKLRKEKNMTQQDLADKLGITKNAVSKWERGISLMDISLLKPISEIFAINVSELLNGERIEKIDDEIINETFTKGTEVYMIKERKKTIIKVVSRFLISIVLILTLLTVISEYNYGIIPLGKNSYMEFSNISTNIGKKKADKYIKYLMKKDYKALDDYVVSSEIYIKKDDDANENWKKLQEEIHSKSYSDNLKEFYKNIDILKYNYEYFYHNGSDYVYSYSLIIKYKNNDYNVSVQITPHKGYVKLGSFGYTLSNSKNDDDMDEYSELYNLLFSAFCW